MQITKRRTEFGLNVKIFGCEEFDKGVTQKLPKDLLKGKGDLLKKDAVLFPCNNSLSKNWFLGVVLCKNESLLPLIAFQDYLSLANCILKAVEKMVSFLQCIDHSVDIKQWSFFSNKPGEIPQQENTYDCHIFTRLCLATRCCIISQTDILTFRQQMIQELH